MVKLEGCLTEELYRQQSWFWIIKRALILFAITRIERTLLQWICPLKITILFPYFCCYGPTCLVVVVVVVHLPRIEEDHLIRFFPNLFEIFFLRWVSSKKSFKEEGKDDPIQFNLRTREAEAAAADIFLWSNNQKKITLGLKKELQQQEKLERCNNEGSSERRMSVLIF